MNARLSFRALFIFFLLFALPSIQESRAASNHEVLMEAEAGYRSLRLCVDDALSKIKPETTTNALLYETTQICYTHLHSQGMLNDFALRRIKFLQQAYDERVLLWLVVAITLSGVALAGIQMMASYRLASSGKALFDQTGELSVSQGRLSLRSSITGLFILICSFAFFWVFVYEIFVLKEVDLDRKGSNVSEQIQQTGDFVPSQASEVR